MLRKQEIYDKRVWPRWLEKFHNSSHKTLFLPGIMGSELYDRKTNDTKWIDLGLDIAALEYKKLTPSGAIDKKGQVIFARDIADPPFSSNDPYTKFLPHLDSGIFCYDWRDSILIEAKRLQKFVELAAGQTERINFVTHSMGGCILLAFLMQTSRFDDLIQNIVFCAPPFHGALRPIRVIEQGMTDTGLDGNWFVSKRSIQRSTATMPGLFQLLVAPSDFWPNVVVLGNGTEQILKHPIRTTESLFSTGSWTNQYRLDLRSKLLKFSKNFHVEKWNRIENVVRRLEEKITIIVGLNGKTLCSATRNSAGQWVLHKVSSPDNGQFSNGDGTVLFQSSLLPGLPTSRYWAEIPPRHHNYHGDLMDRPNVIAGIQAIVEAKDVSSSGLVNYDKFVDKIDWSAEAASSADPRMSENLDYVERAHLRTTVPKRQWGRALNPGGNDAETFYITREAALRVLEGKDLASEATRIGQSPEFLNGHIRTLVMPIFYS